MTIRVFYYIFRLYRTTTLTEDISMNTYTLTIKAFASKLAEALHSQCPLKALLPVAACPSCGRLTEGSGLEPHPKDLRLQFFETQEQCRSLKQEITSSIRHCA